MHMIWLLNMAIELKACTYRYLRIFFLKIFLSTDGLTKTSKQQTLWLPSQTQ